MPNKWRPDEWEEIKKAIPATKQVTCDSCIEASADAILEALRTKALGPGKDDREGKTCHSDGNGGLINGVLVFIPDDPPGEGE